MLIHENVRYNNPCQIVFAFDEHSDLECAILAEITKDLEIYAHWVLSEKKSLVTGETQRSKRSIHRSRSMW
jgi:hypothetical protein